MTKDKRETKGKARKLSTAKPKDDTPSDETLRAARELASRVSPLILDLFNAPKKEDK